MFDLVIIVKCLIVLVIGVRMLVVKVVCSSSSGNGGCADDSSVNSSDDGVVRGCDSCDSVFDGGNSFDVCSCLGDWCWDLCGLAVVIKGVMKIAMVFGW